MFFVEAEFVVTVARVVEAKGSGVGTVLRVGEGGSGAGAPGVGVAFDCDGGRTVDGSCGGDGSALVLIA